MKKFKNEKGFTLVEIIVVLVILAILAAAAIPTMLGFVDDAKGKTEVANARAAYVAAQTISTEKYATTTGDAATKKAACEAAITLDSVTKLTGSLDPNPTEITATVDGATGKVTKIVYKGEKTVTITAGGSAVIS